MTDFSKIVDILGELYYKYRDEKNGDFSEFIEYNDLGLPLAYFAREGLITMSHDAEKYVIETWNVLMDEINPDEDTDYDNLDEVLADFVDRFLDRPQDE